MSKSASPHQDAPSAEVATTAPPLQTAACVATEQYCLLLATKLDTERGTVYRWVHEQRDPSAETLVEITRALRTLNPDAAQAFVQRYQRYLGDIAEGLENS